MNSIYKNYQLYVWNEAAGEYESCGPDAIITSENLACAKEDAAAYLLGLVMQNGGLKCENIYPDNLKMEITGTAEDINRFHGNYQDLIATCTPYGAEYSENTDGEYSDGNGKLTITEYYKVKKIKAE